MIFKVIVPHVDVNDNNVIVGDWYVKEGDFVKKGDTICLLETSKTVFELNAEINGYIKNIKFKAEENVLMGEVICCIVDQYDEVIEDNKVNSNQSKSKVAVCATERAIQLAQEKNVNLANIVKKGIILEKDIINYLNAKDNEPDIGKEYIKDNAIIIIGAGGHAKTCIDLIKQTKEYSIAGVIDNKIKKGNTVLGVPVIGSDNDLKKIFSLGIKKAILAVGAVTNHFVREMLYKKIKDIGFVFPTIIHPNASVEPSAKISVGNQIMANAVIGSDVEISENCIINSGAVVSHDSVLAENVHIAPGAIIAGGVKINKNTLIGMGTTVYLNISIGENVIIHNSCRITKNISDNSIIDKNYF